MYALETELAKNQWTRVQNRDADKTYNKVSTTDLAKTLGEFSWNDYAAGSKLTNVNEIIIGQPSYFEALGKIVAATDLQSWQDYLTFHTVNDYADKLSKAFVDRQFQFYSTTLRGVKSKNHAGKSCGCQ